jgi:hypothetical protein
LSSLISWTTIFEDILAAHAKGVICVVENTCDQTFTVEINGQDAIFRDYGDLHDEKYTDLGLTYDLEDLDLEKVTATRIPFDDSSSCQYTLSVYPSDATKISYESNAPLVYAIAAVVAFILTLCVVGIYDCIQERRNQSVLKAATEARAIVSSLFPAVVRDRLFETNRENQKKKKNKKKRKKRNKKNSSAAPDEIMADENLPTLSESSLVSDLMERAPNAPLSPTIVQQLMDSMHGSRHGDLPPRIHHKNKSVVSHPKHRLKSYLSQPSSLHNEDSDDFGLAKPIADLFPHTTVLFADIVVRCGMVILSIVKIRSHRFFLLFVGLHCLEFGA